VEIACMENHNFNIFISPETGNISIIPMLNHRENNGVVML
jgi:hypothetical protein